MLFTQHEIIILITGVILMLAGDTVTHPPQNVDGVSSLRLIGGKWINEGNIEVFARGEWRFVCDDGFGFLEADAVCRSLRYQGAAKYTKNNQFGKNSPDWRRSTAKFWLSQVNCSPSDFTIRNCESDGLGVHDCGPTEIAGVVCWSKKMSHCPMADFPCDDKVTCIPRDNVCDGNVNCPDKSDEAEELCNDVSVTRLSSFNSTNIPGAALGAVQVKRNGAWGKICDRKLVTGNEAKVLCRSLGYKEGWHLGFPSSYLGMAEGNVLVSQPMCRGTEEWIGECPNIHWGRNICDSPLEMEDYGVFCYDGGLKVRLTRRTSSNTGRVEMKMSGKWGGVCGTGFDIFDAQVICRMLGYHGDALAHRLDGPGTKPTWQMNLNCDGSEKRLQQCSLRFSDCSELVSAGVTCSHRVGQIDMDLEVALGNDECGVPENATTEFISSLVKIRGGDRPSVFDVPWLISLRFVNGILICGGVIISEDFVLTAAHCIIDSDFVVRTGDYNSEVIEEYEEEFMIKKVWLHEHYTELAQGDNDIALIKIRRKNGRGIRFGSRVKPICLPKVGTSYTSLERCSVAGWGRAILFGQPSTIPKVGKQLILEGYSCKEKEEIRTKNYTSSMICAGFAPKLINACRGDSGGPLSCQSGGRHTLVGLVSSGPLCGLTPFYDLYARVTKFLGWILEKIESSKD